MKGDRSEIKNGLTGLDRATQDIWADESVKKKKQMEKKKKSKMNE